jgi:hypothetical protein
MFQMRLGTVGRAPGNEPRFVDARNLPPVEGRDLSARGVRQGAKL